MEPRSDGRHSEGLKSVLDENTPSDVCIFTFDSFLTLLLAPAAAAAEAAVETWYNSGGKTLLLVLQARLKPAQCSCVSRANRMHTGTR